MTNLRIVWHINLLLLLFLITVPFSVVHQQDIPPASEWTQDAHDAQHTAYTYEEPLEPWTFLWAWNGPDEQGGTGGHFYEVPPEARTVTGGNAIFVPAGTEGLYALAKADGQPIWHITNTSFKAAPAYDPTSKNLIVGGSDGRLYRINAESGTITSTYEAGSPLEKAVVLADNFAYVVTNNGQLHKIDFLSMTRQWVYEGGATVATPPAYSAKRGIVVYATQDLFVHAVNDADGKEVWNVKPTPNQAGFPNQYDGQYPVIAEQHGIVFVRMRLDHNQGLWGGPGNSGMYPTSNGETRAFLVDNPDLQNLFALDLDTGEKAFIPAVGYSGHEGYVNGEAFLDTGPLPVIYTSPDGKEVAYMAFRSGQGNPPDGRWDSHMGEMVLDNETIPDLAAGDLRFVKFENSEIYITDEAESITLGGSTIFATNWTAIFSTTIINRNINLGLNFENPIDTERHPIIVRNQKACDDYDPQTHWTTCDLALFGDTRTWPSPGWWVYWNVNAPYNPPDGYTGGVAPRFTYVSDGLIVVEGEAGDLFVLKHSGKS
ncbi:MAG: PQQ-binding-like beta-propeller repeat protein [Anaerolineae bacterium]